MEIMTDAPDIILYILLTIAISCLTYQIGKSRSITNDIKSLDYDNLKKKYKQLLDTYKIIEKEKRYK